MVISEQDDESKSTEKIWCESGFFGDQRTELTILKANFPENTLVYVNCVFSQWRRKSNIFRFCGRWPNYAKLILTIMNINKMR